MEGNLGALTRARHRWFGVKLDFVFEVRSNGDIVFIKSWRSAEKNDKHVRFNKLNMFFHKRANFKCNTQTNKWLVYSAQTII